MDAFPTPSRVDAGHAPLNPERLTRRETFSLVVLLGALSALDHRSECSGRSGAGPTAGQGVKSAFYNPV